MTMPTIAGQPPLMAIYNMATGERIMPQFNPQDFQYQLQVVYGELNLPGAGYQPQQYSNTSNGSIPLNLFYMSRDESERRQRDQAERFLLALCFPRRGAGNISQHAPPRTLISWPGYASLVCVIRQLNIRVTRFNMQMIPIEETFQLTLQTQNDGQIFSEDVARQGLRRPSSRAVGSNGNRVGVATGLPTGEQWRR